MPFAVIEKQWDVILCMLEYTLILCMLEYTDLLTVKCQNYFYRDLQTPGAIEFLPGERN